MVPVMLQMHWCLYAWDFLSKKLTIIDTVKMGGSKTYMEDIRKNSVYVLHNAMLRCMNELFGMSKIVDDEWKYEYKNFRKTSGIR